jgi:Flp pilus assembly protein TadD
MSRKFFVLGTGVIACGVIALGYRATLLDNRAPEPHSPLEVATASAPSEVSPSPERPFVDRSEPPASTELAVAPDASLGVRPLLKNARALLEEGRPAEAESSALAATRIDPKRSSAWNLLGRAQLAQDALEEAEASFARAVACDSTNAYALNNLGYVRLQSGAWTEARVALEAAVALRDDVAYFHNNLGVAYERLGNLDLAARAYRRAVELRPDHPTAQASLARIMPRVPPADLASSADSSGARPPDRDP